MRGNSSQVSGLPNVGHGVSWLQGMESVKQADASASAAGKGIGASALHHHPSTVSIQKARCAAAEARACAASVSALIPGALAASVSTVPLVTQPAVKTGMSSLSSTDIKQPCRCCFVVLPFLVSKLPYKLLPSCLKKKREWRNFRN